MKQPICDYCQAGAHDHANGVRCMHLVLGDTRVSVCGCKTT